MRLRKADIHRLCLFCFMTMSCGMMLNGVHFKKSQRCLTSNNAAANLQTPRLLTCATECSTIFECKIFSYSSLSKTCKLGTFIDYMLDICLEGEEVYQSVDTLRCEDRSTSGPGIMYLKPEIIKVWCDLVSPDGPWIVFLKRFDGTADFDRSFNDYKLGFGDIAGEFWLGLENLHTFTRNNYTRIRIDLQAHEAPSGKGLTAFDLYEKFYVGDESSDYTLLELNGYSGNAGDVTMTSEVLKGQKFTTKDKDLDTYYGNCAVSFGGGWWFDTCYSVCLTCGPWKSSGVFKFNAIVYEPYAGYHALRAAEMKLKLP